MKYLQYNIDNTLANLNRQLYTRLYNKLFYTEAFMQLHNLLFLSERDSKIHEILAK